MSSQRSQESALLSAGSARQSREAYDVGFGGLRNQQNLLQSAQAEPGYLKDAFGQQRAGLQEGILGQSTPGIQQQLAATQGAAQGGNTQGNLSSDAMGARMAQALYSSRIQEGLGSIEQANKIMSMKMGLATNAGNEALGAAGNQLRNIALEPNYNRTYANVLGGINAAGAVYGGLNQGGPQADPYLLRNSATYQTGDNAGWLGGAGGLQGWGGSPGYGLF